MKVSKDICQLIAERITDLKTWHAFSLVCKNGYRVTNILFKDKRFEFANSYPSQYPKPQKKELFWHEPDELVCCPGSDPEGTTEYINYHLPINGVIDKWCFQVVRTHNGDVVEKTEYFRDGKINYKTQYRHNGTIISHTEFIRQKIKLNTVLQNVYNTTYYYPDGKTTKYTGRHSTANPEAKFGYWSKFLKKGQLLCTEYWTAEHNLGHVTFHDKPVEDREDEDLLATDSESLEIIDIPTNKIIPDTETDSEDDVLPFDESDSFQFDPNDSLEDSDSEIGSTADSLSIDSEESEIEK